MDGEPNGGPPPDGAGPGPLQEVEGEDRVRSLLAAATAEDAVLYDPPPDLWDRIVGELGAELPDAPADAGADAGAGVEADAGAVEGTVVPLAAARSWNRPRILLVAAAVALLAGLGGFLALRGNGQGGPAPLAEVAITGASLPDGFDRPGEAKLFSTGGRYRIEVDLPDGVDSGDGYLELWLIDRKVEGMVSLGPIDGSGTYAVPRGVDPTGFPVVDVSREPPDGVPTHSGASLLRGTLAL